MVLGQSVSSNRGLVEADPPFLKVKFMLICSLIYRQISNFAIMKPQIAIITGNTLEAIGLESIVRKMMPKADVLLLPSFSALDQSAGFFHFFISSETLLSHAQFFLQRKQQTIVLMHGEETLPLQGFRTFNVRQPEDVLLRSILQMAQAGHRHRPRPVLEAQGEMQRTSPLTPRETEVLRLVVSGLLNKEIANRLGVSLTTVISHRKNLTAKLGFRSVSALTIYAVTHGIAAVEEI